MDQRITGYRKDDEDQWIAELECGHFQHIRHNPPWVIRNWVTSPRGRNSMIGAVLSCRKCDNGAPSDFH